MFQVLKLEKQLQTLVNENMCLRNKAREDEARYVSEAAIYKNELKSHRSNSAHLNFEIDFLKNNISCCQRKLTALGAENEELRREVEELRGGLEEEAEKVCELDKKRMELEAVSEEQKERIRGFDGVQEEWSRVKKELVDESNRLKESIRNLEFKRPLCSVEEHGDWENVVKQNRVLQDIVKAMRRDRSESAEKLLEMERAEEKIGKLERLVEQMKGYVLSGRNFAGVGWEKFPLSPHCP